MSLVSNLISIILGLVIIYVVMKLMQSGSLNLDGLFSGLFGPGVPAPGVPAPGGVGLPTAGTGNSFVAAGDFSGNAKAKQVVTAMASTGAGTFVGLGDYSYGGSAQSWFDEIMAPLKGRVMFASLGNHDNNTFLQVFGLNSWEYGSRFAQSTYLVAINTENPSETAINGLLAKAQADPSIRMIVCFMHKPIDGPKSHHGNENKQFHEIFKKYPKVVLVINGHNHTYARMEIKDGITYVTIGTGGRDFYKASTGTGVAKVINDTNGFLLCTEGPGGLQCQFMDINKQVLDSFNISPQIAVPAA